MIGDSVTLGVAIWMVNILNGVFGFYNEYAAGRAADALRKMLPATARVVREGETRTVPAEELVPGDVMVDTHAPCWQFVTVLADSQQGRAALR